MNAKNLKRIIFFDNFLQKEENLVYLHSQKRLNSSLAQLVRASDC
jgi:hypothetical protein